MAHALVFACIKGGARYQHVVRGGLVHADAVPRVAATEGIRVANSRHPRAAAAHELPPDLRDWMGAGPIVDLLGRSGGLRDADAIPSPGAAIRVHAANGGHDRIAGVN